MSEESDAGPSDSGGSQGQDLEGVSILTWSTDDVQAWLKKEGYSECTDSLAKLNGKRLAQAKLVMLTKSLGGNEVIAMGVWGSVEALLREQNEDKLLPDKKFRSSMATRGTPVQPGNAAGPAHVGEEAVEQANKEEIRTTSLISEAVATAVVQMHRLQEEREDAKKGELSQVSGSKFREKHLDKIAEFTEYEEPDPEEFWKIVKGETEIDEAAIKGAVESAWTSDTTPIFIPQLVWNQLGTANGTMKESLKELYQNKNTKEIDYECRMICIVYCAIQGLPKKYQGSVDILPTYGGYKEKFKAKPRECSVFAPFCTGAEPDGYIRKNQKANYGLAMEAKPAFLKGKAGAITPYDKQTLVHEWHAENLCQVEMPLPRDQKCGAGILMCWTHWIFSLVSRKATSEGVHLAVIYNAISLPENPDDDNYLDELVRVTVAIAYMISFHFDQNDASQKTLATLEEAVEDIHIGETKENTSQPNASQNDSAPTSQVAAPSKYSQLSSAKKNRHATCEIPVDDEMTARNQTNLKTDGVTFATPSVVHLGDSTLPPAVRKLVLNALCNIPGPTHFSVERMRENAIY